MSDSSRPHGLQPTRLLCPWDFPGKSTGVSSDMKIRREGREREENGREGGRKKEGGKERKKEESNSL